MSTQRWRWGGWLISIALLIIVGLLWSRLETIEQGGMARIQFYALAWFAMLGSVFFFPNLPQGPAQSRGRLFRNREFLLILGAALLVRMAFWGAPVSDDVNRYLWEGKIVAAGENPYATTIDDPRLESYRDSYWVDTNHKDRFTAYPPGMELLMAAAGQVWYHPSVFKLLALAGDIWSLVMVMLLGQRLHKPIRWLGFYAFNPVVLSAFAAEAHFDSLMVAGILTALVYGQNKRFGRAWFWLAFAVQMKLMALVLAPLFFLVGGWRKCWVFAFALVIPSLLFWPHLGGLVYGLFNFGGESAFNGGLFETLRLFGIAEDATRRIGYLIFALGMLLLVVRAWRERSVSLVDISFAALGLLVVCSPIVHLWYLAWIVPVLALRPSLSWLYLSGAIGVTFLAWHSAEAGRGWGYGREVVVASWLPFFLLLAFEKRWFWSRLKLRKTLFAADSGEVPTLDIVIPVYGEGERLAGFLTALKSVSPEAQKIIVVDGRPDAADLAIARESGVIAVASERGRGNQIARGFQEATADLVAIIHADTIPLEGWVSLVQKAAQAEPATTAFTLGQRFQQGNLGLLFVEILNEARVLFNGSVFGDQTLIVRRGALQQSGGFPAQPLMEDVEVSWRLLAAGPISYLGREWTVSTRKWEKRFVSRFRQVIGLVIRYRWVRFRGPAAAAEFSKKLFQEYYR